MTVVALRKRPVALAFRRNTLLLPLLLLLATLTVMSAWFAVLLVGPEQDANAEPAGSVGSANVGRKKTGATANAYGAEVEHATADSVGSTQQRRTYNAADAFASVLRNVTKPQRRTLPDMTEGGFVFFLHVPKTGGSTLRIALQNMTDRIEYGFVSGRGLWDQDHPVVDRYVSWRPRRPTKHRKVVILEVHGRDSPHLSELVPYLDKWKAVAAQNNIPTFFFTVLREPLAYALSYFNFFYVQRRNPNFPHLAPTEHNFLEYMLWNPQCQFLARGEYSLREKVKQQPSLSECVGVLRDLLGVMDWIGTTDRLSTETLPLLANMLRLPSADLFRPQLVSNKDSQVAVSKKQLSSETLDVVRRMSTMDAQLLQAVRTIYDLTIWDGLHQ